MVEGLSNPCAYLCRKNVADNNYISRAHRLDDGQSHLLVNLSYYDLSSVRLEFLRENMRVFRSLHSVMYVILRIAAAAPLGPPLQLLKPGLANI